MLLLHVKYDVKSPRGNHESEPSTNKGLTTSESDVEMKANGCLGINLSFQHSKMLGIIVEHY